jgi:aryl-alcohol dehydrogenase-like predicted oxidoreductase
VEENVKAVDVVLSEEVLEKIEGDFGVIGNGDSW